LASRFRLSETEFVIPVRTAATILFSHRDTVLARDSGSGMSSLQAHQSPPHLHRVQTPAHLPQPGQHLLMVLPGRSEHRQTRRRLRRVSGKSTDALH
jgi:hypothetical protein